MDSVSFNYFCKNIELLEEARKATIFNDISKALTQIYEKNTKIVKDELATKGDNVSTLYKGRILNYMLDVFHTNFGPEEEQYEEIELTEDEILRRIETILGKWYNQGNEIYNENTLRKTVMNRNGYLRWYYAGPTAMKYELPDNKVEKVIRYRTDVEQATDAIKNLIKTHIKDIDMVNLIELFSDPKDLIDFVVNNITSPQYSRSWGAEKKTREEFDGGTRMDRAAAIKKVEPILVEYNKKLRAINIRLARSLEIPNIELIAAEEDPRIGFNRIILSALDGIEEERKEAFDKNPEQRDEDEDALVNLKDSDLTEIKKGYMQTLENGGLSEDEFFSNINRLTNMQNLPDRIKIFLILFKDTVLATGESEERDTVEHDFSFDGFKPGILQPILDKYPNLLEAFKFYYTKIFQPKFQQRLEYLARQSQNFVKKSMNPAIDEFDKSHGLFPKNKKGRSQQTRNRFTGSEGHIYTPVDDYFREMGKYN